MSNIGYACTGRHVERGNGDVVALRWVPVAGGPTDYTYSQLDSLSSKFANLLSLIGMRPGDVLALALPRCVDVFVGFLGALKARAVVSPLFHSFGEDALMDRLSDSSARAVMVRRRSMKRVEAIRRRLSTLEFILVTDLPPDEGRPEEGIYSCPALFAEVGSVFEVAKTDPDTPSVLHYTSGSTGRPKGVLHVHGSLVQQEYTAREVLGLSPADVFWCTADQGWVTGTSYGIIGPWSIGCTQVHYEGGYDGASWMRILDDYGVTVWYTAPTALRMLMRGDSSHYKMELARLRSIFSIGEPLNPECIYWAREVLGREIYDTWFQTETGAIMVSNRPGLPVKPGSMGLPIELVRAEVMDDEGFILPVGATGQLAIEGGWPSMFRAYLGRPEAYHERFRNGWYLTGDLAWIDEDGYIWFVGRADDVINTAGHLVGPFEVESALLEVEGVAEAGVVGVADEMLHEKVVAFVALKEGVEHTRELELKLRLQVQNQVSTIASPQEIVVVPELPKNDSGKILRRVLRDRYSAKECDGLGHGEVD